MTHISYAVTVADEILEVKTLLNVLFEYKTYDDEIVVLVDGSKAPSELIEYLEDLWKLRDEKFEKDFYYVVKEFDGHFGDWKNHFHKLCSGEYIFQIDADEIPHELLLVNLPVLLRENPVDLLFVPRVNTVQGLTSEHIRKWGWTINEKGWVNWPDRQGRIYRNIPEVKWVNKVHEHLSGSGIKMYGNLPLTEEFALYHPKDIKRQERQNAYYNTLI